MKMCTKKPIDWTKPLKVGDSDILLRVLCTDAPGPRPVICISDTGEVYKYHRDGRYYSDVGSCTDAVNVSVPKKKITVLTLLYPSGEVAHRTVDGHKRMCSKSYSAQQAKIIKEEIIEIDEE